MLNVRALSLLLLVFSAASLAHGERAQQANVRMRTINWYDITLSSVQLTVGDRATLSGRFRTSRYWPDHLPSVEERVFLNVGASGPNFIREASNIDGVSMVQSTQLELGQDYGFEILLKARRPGRFHLHPVMNVLDSGTMVGPGIWVEIAGSADDFTNTVTTMFGREIDLETFNLGTIFGWHAIWFVIGGAWIAYWLRQRPVLIPRLRAVQQAEREEGDGDAVITNTDRKVAIGFLVGTLLMIVCGYQWAERNYPVTTPLRTAKVDLPSKPPPAPAVGVQLDAARYHIPGRSFEMELTVENKSDTPLRVGEFTTANVRFINPSVKTVQPADSHDLVAPHGLRVEGGPIEPGATGNLRVYAEDALWETQRLAHMINDPDSVIAGLLFFHGPGGAREIVEIGGRMLPVFNCSEDGRCGPVAVPS